MIVEGGRRIAARGPQYVAMEASEGRWRAEMEAIDGILEDATERLPNVRYNAKTLGFVLSQMEKLQPVRSWAKQHAGMAMAGGIGDRDGGGPTSQSGRETESSRARWSQLKSAMRKGERLITRHTEPLHKGKFTRFSAVRSEAEAICRELKMSVDHFAASNSKKGVGDPIKTVVDTKCVVEDKVYLYYFLSLVVEEVHQENLHLGSKMGKLVHREWELMRAEHTARRQHLMWVDDSKVEALQGVGKVVVSGTGEVHSAIHRAVWKDVYVAVKTYVDLARELSLEAKASFFTSIEFQRSMACSNIVRIFAVSHSGAVLMEQAKCNLSELCVESPELPWLTKCNLLLGAAKGLKFVHKKGMLHGTVKSSNFLIFGSDIGNYTIKVTDFGMAAVKSELMCKNTSLQQASSLYVAPEVLEGGMATMASDVFGLGVVMFELTAQRPPYANVGSRELLLAWKKRGEDPCPVPEECPTELLELLRQCILPAPTQRPSMEEVVKALKHMSQPPATPIRRSSSLKQRLRSVQIPVLPSMLYGSKKRALRALDYTSEAEKGLGGSTDSGINVSDIFTNSQDEGTSSSGWDMVQKGRPSGDRLATQAS